MTRTISLLAIATLALGCKKDDPHPPAPPPRDKIAEIAAEDQVIDVADDDAAMEAAIAGARASIDLFADRLSKAQPGQTFSVKKPFPHGTSAEHMWLVDVRAIDGGFEGRLDNQPRDAKDARLGERYPVTRAELSDWLISDAEGRIWGGYTLRALLPTMAPDERAAFEQALQPLP